MRPRGGQGRLWESAAGNVKRGADAESPRAEVGEAAGNGSRWRDGEMFAGSLVPRTRLGSFRLLRARRRPGAALWPCSTSTRPSPTLRGDGKWWVKLSWRHPLGLPWGCRPTAEHTASRFWCCSAMEGVPRAWEGLQPSAPTPSPCPGPAEKCRAGMAGGAGKFCLRHLWDAFMAV